MSIGLGILIGIGGFLALVLLYDLTQRKHSILRNFPIIGHLRYLLEAIGPELRQYVVTNNDEERPFSRDQRSWVYASAKQQNNSAGFGTDNELESSPNYLIVKQAAIALPGPPGDGHDADTPFRVPCGRILGEWRERPGAFRPASAVYVSGMSFGSLSGPAVEALNRGCAMVGALHNTGEGGLSRYHRHGGDLIFQIGTAYFGCGDTNRNFSMDALQASIEGAPVRAIEIKLSQGAKPGRGGVLPAPKVTREIAEARGVPEGVTCVSPPAHREFDDVRSLIKFCERLAGETGVPVSVKSAVGDHRFFKELAQEMRSMNAGPDMIVIDGGEGGTGAAPPSFTDHVAFPFREAFRRVYRAFAEEDMHSRVLFAGAGRLGFPERALFSIGMGCDMVALAREPLLAIGCIQAQRCHTGHCPTGVATQSKWLMRGLDPTDKAARLGNYLMTLRKEMLWLCRAIGVPHPAMVTLNDFEFLDEMFHSTCARELFDYSGADWGALPSNQLEALLSELPAYDVEPWRRRQARAAS